MGIAAVSSFGEKTYILKIVMHLAVYQQEKVVRGYRGTKPNVMVVKKETRIVLSRLIVGVVAIQV